MKCNKLRASVQEDIGLQKIRKIARETDKDGKERGFSFCDENGKLVISKIATGSKDFVIIPQCKGKLIGAVHTHPDCGILSIIDILGHPEREWNCIVHTTVDRKQVIRCFKFRKNEKRSTLVALLAAGKKDQVLAEANMQIDEIADVCYLEE